MKNIHYQLDAFYVKNNNAKKEDLHRVKDEFLYIKNIFENIKKNFFEKNKYFMISKDYISIYDKNVNDINLYGKRLEEFEKKVTSNCYDNKDNSIIENKCDIDGDKNDNKK